MRKLTPIAQHNNTLNKVQQQECKLSNRMHTLSQHISTAEHVGNTLSTTSTPQNTTADAHANNCITTNLVLHMLRERYHNKCRRATRPAPGAPGLRA